MAKAKDVKASYVTLNKDGKAVWEPGLRAEITSRRQPRVKRKTEEAEEPPISCDLKAALALSPEARSAWLAKALAAIPKGRAKALEVYDIITHKKFAAGVPDELGQAMLKQVKESLLFFTERQQLGIAKSRLVKDFKPLDPNRKGGGRRRHDDDSSDDASFDDEPRQHYHHRRHVGEAERRREYEEEQPLGKSSRSSGATAAEAEPPRERREDPEEREDEPPIPPEELARMERERAVQEAERQRKREQELRRLEAERKAHEERERMRKAKIGSAFLMGGEDEDDAPAVPLGRVPVLDRRRDDLFRSQEEPLMGSIKYAASATSGANTVVAASASSAIQTMGGDNIVNEAQQILVKGAGECLHKGSKEQRKGSRSRSRRRKRSPSRSPSPRDRKKEAKGEDRRRRTWDSLRSPTPDGHLRGRMRAARKAKMMAQMLQQGNVPRVA